MNEKDQNSRMTKLSQDTTFFGAPSKPYSEKSGTHAACGDHITLYLTAEHQSGALRYSAEACSIVKASAAALANLINHNPAADPEKLLLSVRHFLECIKLGSTASLEEFFEKDLRSFTTDPAENLSIRNQLRAIESIKTFPVRLKCAKLPWVVLEELLLDINK